jgi:MerR family gold-responsive transcriptional activator of gol and ges genes
MEERSGEAIMNIGELARKSEVNAKMIRRYEELGIIPKAGRSFSGYRIYSEKDVHNLRFVKRARELGFSMKEIKELLGLWRNKKRSSSDVKRLTSKHIHELEHKVAELQGMLATLKKLSSCCHGDERPDCPILEELDSSTG